MTRMTARTHPYLVATVVLTMAVSAAAFAQQPAPSPAPSAVVPAPTAEARPYDDRLTRLSELLGAVHFLRELCGSSDGQLWREKMQELLDAEGSSALRKARLTRSFNTGYRSYARTYTSCTPSAQTAVSRFVTEAAQLAENLVRTVP
jgi:uncharacterized protein (TIGR02301 family)